MAQVRQLFACKPSNSQMENSTHLQLQNVLVMQERGVVGGDEEKQTVCWHKSERCTGFATLYQNVAIIANCNFRLSLSYPSKQSLLVSIIFSSFWQQFYSLFSNVFIFLVGCVTIPEHMRSLRCYSQAALPPSHFMPGFWNVRYVIPWLMQPIG